MLGALTSRGTHEGRKERGEGAAAPRSAHSLQALSKSPSRRRPPGPSHVPADACSTGGPVEKEESRAGRGSPLVKRKCLRRRGAGERGAGGGRKAANAGVWVVGGHQGGRGSRCRVPSECLEDIGLKRG